MSLFQSMQEGAVRKADEERQDPFETDKLPVHLTSGMIFDR